MGAVRRVLLSALPKFALSRTTGMLMHIPLPRFLRSPAYRLFAWRYGADLSEMQGETRDYRSLADFFRRPLRDGARSIAKDKTIVWPCDGKIITSGPITDGQIPQVKGRDYSVEQLLQDRELAGRLDGGHQATIYLAPRDYHRVHAPFGGEVVATKHILGKLFPVNPGAVDSVPDLFPRNERVVFQWRLAGAQTDGLPAAVVMVSALNVGDTLVTVDSGAVAQGDEIGQFGFGSTTIVLVPAGGPEIPELPRETVGKMGEALG